MKKLLTIVVLGLLWNSQVSTKEDVIYIQCQNDDFRFKHYKPIYTINLKTNSAKAGKFTYTLVNFSETEIILGIVNPGFYLMMEIDRISGRYETNSTLYGETNEPDSKLLETGICVKKEKAF